MVDQSGRAPVVGITMGTAGDRVGYQLGAGYADGVERAGGVPVALCYRSGRASLRRMVDLCDAVLFTGGDDLDPALYGEAWHPSAVPVDPLRQAFELALLREVQQRRLPILAICLGAQLINVARGGSLHQHLPEVKRDGALEHRRLELPTRRHDVTVADGSLLHRVVGRERLSVNTSHQQAVARLGTGLRATAHAPDGVIEAFEDPEYPLLLAVQWHPEQLLDEPEHLALFGRLVQRGTRV